MNKGALAAAIVLLSSGLLCAQSQSGQNQNQNQPNPNQDQVPPAAQAAQPSQQPQKEQSVTGKTGNESTHINVSTTRSAGQETPGVQTDLGAEQQLGKHVELKNQKAPNPNPRQGPGAPPNWEQVGQTPASADRNASAASRAEVGGSGGGTLGVNAMPKYDQTSGAQQGSASGKTSHSKAKTNKSQKAAKQSQQTQSPQPQ